MSVIEGIQHLHVVTEATETALAPNDKALAHAYENSTKHGIPMIAVSPAQGKFLSLLTRIASAKNVLEIGTLGGYSTIWFARALHKAKHGGKVTSIEIDPKHRDVAIENLGVAGVKVPAEAEILLGAAMDVLPQIASDIKAGTREPFDFIFIDADWDHHWEYFDWAVKLSRGSGSVIYIDNVVRQLLETGVVGPAKRDTSVADLLEKVGADDRVDSVIMQTVGSKSYDGFLLGVVV